MFTNFINQDYIRIFTEKIRRGDSNPIVLQNERDQNRYLIVTPVFNKNKFLIDIIETEITIQKEEITLPKNTRDLIPTCKKILNRGKELFRKFVYDLEIFNGHVGNEKPSEKFLGIDKDGYELWEENDYWKRVI